MKFDKYSCTARIFPSVITFIPFLLFTIYCDIDNLKDVFDNLLRVRIIGGITISIVLLYLLIQVNRFLGKFIFEKSMFKNELEMPTTNFLLFKDSEFSKEYKVKIRKQIKADFEIELSNKSEEYEDSENARKRIVEAVGLIRQKVKNGRLLLQHNIEYGFARNLIGGSIFGAIMSIVDVFYFHINDNAVVVGLSIALTIFFVFLLLFHKLIIKHFGNQYAKRLFQEYLQK